MPQTVLLTGASGYIAKHIALQLVQAGYIVRGSVRDMARADQVKAALRPHLTDASILNTRLHFITLDLSQDDGWAKAMAGVDVVMHTASPFPMVQPKDENVLIKPAVDGALRALRAANDAGVKRVILTSSTAAISGSSLPTGQPAYDETCWSDPDDPSLSAYSKSKTLAERAAWDFVNNTATGIDLTVVNPGFVVGPPLDGQFGTSVAVIQRILRARDPMVPRFGFMAVDVRDVAAMHLAVIDKPVSFGQRIMTVDRFVWFADMARAIKDAMPDQRIVTREAPDWVVRLLGLFDPAVRSIVPSLGKAQAADNSRAIATLGRPMRPALTAVVETARYLRDNNLT